MSFQQLEITLLADKKIYFASDFHLGAPNHAESLKRERRLVSWLESIRHNAQMICLVGDLFDFWYEHKRVVPRGYVRFLGKLGELTDAGIEIIAFPGNHDMWMTDYFEKELNIKTYRKPLELIVHSPQFTVGSPQSAVGSSQSTVSSPQSTVGSPQFTVGSSQSTVHSRQFTVGSSQATVNSKPQTINLNSQTVNSKQGTTINPEQETVNFLIAHGDGLGPGDYNYKILKKVFESRLARWAFGNLLHPDWALWLGQSWALHSWKKHEKEGQPQYLGADKEWLVQYAKAEDAKNAHDFYIFGHRHIELDLAISQQSRVLILGDWIVYNTYAEFDGQTMALKSYQ